MNVDGKLLELSSASPDGKRRFKVSLHEIYPDHEHWNNNGICYQREYVEKNMHSVVGMPLAAEFLDDSKSVPHSHGQTGMKDGMPVFENSESVGTFDEVSIETITLDDGRECTVLCGGGTLHQQRYPQLVDWIERSLLLGNTIHGSVEFVGTAENAGYIKYENDFTGEGRVPTEYLYSGYALLTVPAGDDAAVMLELNEHKEDRKMDEQTRNEIKSVISEAISAHTTERAALNAEIEQLKTELQAKGVELESLTSQLNAVTEERDKAKADSEEEVNACKKREQEQAELCVRVSNELRELKGKACVNELDTMLTNFTAKEQECAAEEIEKFRADPLGCGIELNQIDTKISAEAFRAMKRSSNKPGAKAELNAFTGPDIFAPMSPECEQLGDFDPAKAIV